MKNTEREGEKIKIGETLVSREIYVMADEYEDKGDEMGAICVEKS